MAVKKSATFQATAGKKKSAPKPPPKYGCPSTDKPMGLEKMVRKILKDTDFAKFIRDLLCAANKGDKEAEKCLASYYSGPTDGELDQVCVSGRAVRARLMKCTEHNQLLNFVAYVD